MFILFAGCLHVFSLKYKTLTLLKTLSADFAGDRPLTVMSPYIITQTRDNLEAHSYKFSKLSVRQMLGRMTLQSGNDEVSSLSLRFRHWVTEKIGMLL